MSSLITTTSGQRIRVTKAYDDIRNILGEVVRNSKQVFLELEVHEPALGKHVKIMINISNIESIRYEPA